MTCSGLNTGDLGERVSIVVRQGVDAELLRFALQNDDGSFVDVTGSSVLAHIRKGVGEDLAAQFVAKIDSPYVLLALPAAVVATLDTGVDARDPAGRYGWDCRIVFPDGSARWLAHGELRVIQSYTRS
ncbi:MAG TPA: hypothetical protein PK177_23280 [Burkholderiaceae bacterium]|nr:hypothetical protein [Burkholderiaceae bacterium]